MPILSHLNARQKQLIDGLLFLVLALMTGSIATWYVSSEHYFYFWDFSGYQNLTLDVTDAFRDSKTKAIASVIESLSQDYNQLFTLPLVPFIFIFGDSRLVYILSIALVYLFPFSLIMGAIATKLIPVSPRPVFWLTAILSLLLPTVWKATLRGYPDIGGVLIIAIAVLAYLQDIRLKKWWQIPVIGLLLALAMLFRRHFAYSILAFFSSISLNSLILAWIDHRVNWRRILTQSLGQAVKIGLIAAISLTTLILLAKPWIYRILNTDYGDLYASYKLPLFQVIRFYAAYSYSLVIWLLVIVGFLIGVLTRILDIRVFTFISLFGITFLAKWLILVRYAGLHYSLHLAPFAILGLSVFIWTIGKKFSGRPRILILIVSFLYLTINFISNLTSIIPLKSKIIRPLFSLNTPPLKRTDYQEFVRLLNTIRQLAPNKQPIYIAAASDILNDDLIKNAEQELYGRQQRILNFFVIPTVDSRDFYPLEQLLQAQYVVVAKPLQLIVKPEEQDLVKVVFDAFTQNWEISQDFKRLPMEFNLERGTVVTIYQRTRPTSQKTAVRTLHTIQQQIGERPGGQLDWILLSNLVPSKITKNSNNTYKLITHFSSDNSKISYLYIGKMFPQPMEVTGSISIQDNRCSGLSLQLSMLNKKGQVIKVTETWHYPEQASNFSLSLQHPKPDYLLLDVLSLEQNKGIDYCSTQIQNLSVSK